MEGARQDHRRCTKSVVSKLALSAALGTLSSPSVSLAEGSRSNSIERWAAGALLTAWNGTSYHDRGCFDAGGRSVPCDSPCVVQITEETGTEYTISLGNRTEVPLNCFIRGGGWGVASFSLLTKGANHVATIQVPSTAKQFFEVVCEASLDQVLASSGGPGSGRVRISILHNAMKPGRTMHVTVER